MRVHLACVCLAIGALLIASQTARSSAFPTSLGGGLAKKTWCKRGESCWPTSAEIAALKAELDPEGTRFLKWDGQPNPRVCAVPVGSPDDQPLYGWGRNNLSALYYAQEPIIGMCFPTVGETRQVCLAAMRNNPMENWHPAFVVWALNAQHVQAAVKFAAKHNLCISVAGTGHDFMNRHGCDGEGVLIRTTLLKDIEWNLTPAGGSVKLGAGIVFSEAQKSASDRGRYISSGWAITVGVAGWTMGGGHGPFAPSAGLGVDNLVEAEIVTADGNLLRASEKENADLWQALRGGGGSAFGALTSLTLRAFVNPAGGFAYGQAAWIGSFCPAGREKLHLIIDKYLEWALPLDKRFSGMAFITPSLSDETQCGGNWTFFINYVFLGSEEEAQTEWAKLVGPIPPDYQHGNHSSSWWEFVQAYSLEPITPVPWLPPSEASHYGGVPSITVSRETVSNGDLAALLKLAADQCPNSKVCSRQEMYHDITGYVGSPQDPLVSISPGFRTAMFHLVFGGWNASMTQRYYAIGENSYFSESAYEHPGDSWKARYWGTNYDQLLKVKQKYDPHGAFWCHNCVGSDLL